MYKSEWGVIPPSSVWNTRQRLVTKANGIIVAAMMIGIIAVADFSLGYDFRLATLYLLPIALVTWVSGAMAGIMASVLATVLWFVSFRISSSHIDRFYFYWDGVAMVTTFVIFVGLLAKLRQALKNSNERFLRVLEGLHAMVYVVDHTDGRLLYANRCFAETVGPIRSVMYAHDFENRFVSEVSRGLVGTALNETSNHVFDFTELRDTADNRCYLQQTGTIPWGNGQNAYVKVLTDITEQKLAEAMKQEHQDALHQTARMAALAETASTITHELNQPLVAIASYNEACIRLLTSGKEDKQEVLEAMEKCRRQAVRAGKIVNGMRDFIRQRQPMRASCDLNLLIRQTIELSEAIITRSQASVAFQLEPSLPTVRVEKTMIEQVVLNLVQNGLDAMQTLEPQQRQITIKTTLEKEASHVAVTVIDRGSGISEEVSQKLYVPFFSTKSQGLGLGLAICRTVIEAHGGRLWHSAHPISGSCFHFTIPVTHHEAE